LIKARASRASHSKTSSLENNSNIDDVEEEDSNNSEHLDRYEDDSSKLARTHQSKSLLQKAQGLHSSTSINLKNASLNRKTLAVPSLGHASSTNAMARKSNLSGAPLMMDTIT
jgi:hypothetical protein